MAKKSMVLPRMNTLTIKELFFYINKKDKTFRCWQNISGTSLMRGLLTFIFLPGSFSTSCMAMSLQSFLTVGGTLLSSSQYLEGECAYKAAGVACVILAVVTIPVDFPAQRKVYSVRYFKQC